MVFFFAWQALSLSDHIVFVFQGTQSQGESHPQVHNWVFFMKQEFILSQTQSDFLLFYF